MTAEKKPTHAAVMRAIATYSYQMGDRVCVSLSDVPAGADVDETIQAAAAALSEVEALRARVAALEAELYALRTEAHVESTKRDGDAADQAQERVDRITSALSGGAAALDAVRAEDQKRIAALEAALAQSATHTGVAIPLPEEVEVFRKSRAHGIKAMWDRTGASLQHCRDALLRGTSAALESYVARAVEAERERVRQRVEALDTRWTMEPCPPTSMKQDWVRLADVLATLDQTTAPTKEPTDG